MKLLSAFLMSFFVSLLLISCKAIEPEDHKTQLEFDPLSDLLQADGINIASIVNVESRQNAMLLAAEQINDAGGVLGKKLNAVPLLLRAQDDLFAVMQSLLTSGIQVVSISGSQAALALMQVASPLNVLSFSESATSPLLTTAIDNDLLFRMSPSDAFQGKLLAQRAWDKGATTAAFVKVEMDTYSQSLSDVFKTEFETLGGSVIVQQDVPFGLSSGFSTYIDAVYSVNPGVVFVSLPFSQASDFFNEANGQNFSGFYVYADNVSGRDEVLRSLVDDTQLSGSIGIAPAKGQAGNSEFVFFNQSYSAFYQDDPEPFNTQIYDFVMVVALATEHAGLQNNTQSPTAVMIRDSLRLVMNPPGEMIGPSEIGRALSLIRQGQEINYTGAYGEIDWDTNGDVVGELVYDIYAIHSAASGFSIQEQVVLDVPLAP